MPSHLFLACFRIDNLPDVLKTDKSLATSSSETLPSTDDKWKDAMAACDAIVLNISFLNIISNNLESDKMTNHYCPTETRMQTKIVVCRLKTKSNLLKKCSN